MNAGEYENIAREYEKMARKAYGKRYVYGVRIFLENGHKPMAELALGDGGRPDGSTVIVPWDSPEEIDEKYVINAYTFIWDEREIVQHSAFDDYVYCSWKDKVSEEISYLSDEDLLDRYFEMRCITAGEGCDRKVYYEFCCVRDEVLRRMGWK